MTGRKSQTASAISLHRAAARTSAHKFGRPVCTWSTVRHHLLEAQPLSVGLFSCLFAPVPADSCGLLRAPADCASRPKRPFPATFHSLLALPLSDLAPWNWPEVRKGRNAGTYRSTGYARTNGAVGLQHRVAEETLRLRFVGSCRDVPANSNIEKMRQDGWRQRSLGMTSYGQLQ